MMGFIQSGKTEGKNGRRKEIRNKKMLNSGECVETQTRSKQKISTHRSGSVCQLVYGRKEHNILNKTSQRYNV